MFKKILIAIACASLLAFAADDPVSVVKSKDAELQNIIKKSKRTAKETERVKSLLNDSFDFALLAKKSLAASDWKAQDEASQQKFEPANMKGTDDARVVAHLWSKGKESVLEYKMTLVNGKWKAWDLVIDDLSTARNYKEQFSKILKDKSFAELIDIISKKADEAEK